MPQGRTGQAVSAPAQAPAPASQTPAQAPAPTTLGELCALPVAVQSQAAYRAAVEARDQVENWVGELKQSRGRIADALRGGNSVDGADRAGLNSRLTETDKQIIGAEAKLVEANSAVIAAASVPCAVKPFIPAPRTGPPEEVFVMGGMVIFFVLFPIAIAFSRRIWRRAGQIMKMPPELTDRLTHLEQSVESVAIEVERVGESQRFVTNLLIEGGPQMLNAGPMNTLEIKERERVEAERRR